jgi:hypothetical protein
MPIKGPETLQPLLLRRIGCRQQKVTLSGINTDLPGLDRLLKLKRRLRKLWQETRDTACKTAINWVSKSIRQLTSRKALERWETKIANTEVTHQAIWPIAKSLMKRDGPKAPIAFRGPLNLTFHPLEKANAIADCLEKQFNMNCATETINDMWRLEFKPCSKL